MSAGCWIKACALGEHDGDHECRCGWEWPATPTLPGVKDAAQLLHDLICDCWEGGPEGTPEPGLILPEGVEVDPENCALGYADGCVIDEPERWEQMARELLAGMGLCPRAER